MKINLTYIFFKKNLSKNLITSLILTLSILIISVLTIFNDSLNRFINTKILSGNDLNSFTILPKNDFFNVIKKAATDQSTIITPEIIETIKSHPNVDSIIPNYTYPGLSSADIRFNNLGLSTETLIFGTEKSKITDLPLTDEIWINQTDPIPAIISQNIIDIFNLSLGPAMGFPEINNLALQTLEVTIYPNRSSNQSFTLKIIGASKQVKLLGLTIPDQTLKQIIRTNFPQHLISPSDLTVKLLDTNELESFRTFIKSLNLNLISNLDLQTNIIKSTLLISTALNIIKIILIISNALIISILFSYQVTTRKKDLATLKLLGATSNYILKTFLGEMAIIFCLSGAFSITFLTISLSLLSNINFSTPFQTILTESITINPLSNLINFLLIFIFGLISTYISTNKVKKLYPIQVLNNQ